MTGVMRFRKKAKLTPRYISPYQFIRRISNVASELELPLKLVVIHPLFYVSVLKKCLAVPSLLVPVESIGVKDSLSYERIPILNSLVYKLMTKEIALVIVLWRNQLVEEATREAEEDMKTKYSHLFVPSNDDLGSNFRSHP